MVRLRRVMGLAAALLMTAGFTTAAAGTAYAADTCGGQTAGYTAGVKGELRIYMEGDNYCAMVWHTPAYWGVYLPTAVQIARKDGALSPQDDGNYRYCAGPVRIATGGMFGYASAWVNGEHLIA
ncbi:hypothetical protein ACFYVL_07475 [Streptomyces sp. NPDC004111]|uniref:hypothetical protein n=1 Tax=Streptomyces sp. NPDC004111 TaxID=3364690 RepID=UPI0036B656F5